MGGSLFLRKKPQTQQTPNPKYVWSFSYITPPRTLSDLRDTLLQQDLTADADMCPQLTAPKEGKQTLRLLTLVWIHLWKIKNIEFSSKKAWGIWTVDLGGYFSLKIPFNLQLFVLSLRSTFSSCHRLSLTWLASVWFRAGSWDSSLAAGNTIF